MIPFSKTQEGDRELIELAFSKKKADERKEWLRQFKVWRDGLHSNRGLALIYRRKARHLPRPHATRDPAF